MSASFACGDCSFVADSQEDRNNHRHREHNFRFSRAGRCALCRLLFEDCFAYFEHFSEAHKEHFDYLYERATRCLSGRPMSRPLQFFERGYLDPEEEDDRDFNDLYWLHKIVDDALRFIGMPTLYDLEDDEDVCPPDSPLADDDDVTSGDVTEPLLDNPEKELLDDSGPPTLVEEALEDEATSAAAVPPCPSDEVEGDNGVSEKDSEQMKGEDEAEMDEVETARCDPTVTPLALEPVDEEKRRNLEHLVDSLLSLRRRVEERQVAAVVATEPPSTAAAAAAAGVESAASAASPTPEQHVVPANVVVENQVLKRGRKKAGQEGSADKPKAKRRRGRPPLDYTMADPLCPPIDGSLVLPFGYNQEPSLLRSLLHQPSEQQLNARPFDPSLQHMQHLQHLQQVQCSMGAAGGYGNPMMQYPPAYQQAIARQSSMMPGFDPRMAQARVPSMIPPPGYPLHLSNPSTQAACLPPMAMGAFPGGVGNPMNWRQAMDSIAGPQSVHQYMQQQPQRPQFTQQPMSMMLQHQLLQQRMLQQQHMQHMQQAQLQQQHNQFDICASQPMPGYHTSLQHHQQPSMAQNVGPLPPSFPTQQQQRPAHVSHASNSAVSVVGSAAPHQSTGCSRMEMHLQGELLLQKQLQRSHQEVGTVAHSSSSQINQGDSRRHLHDEGCAPSVEKKRREEQVKVSTSSFSSPTFNYQQVMVEATEIEEHESVTKMWDGEKSREEKAATCAAVAAPAAVDLQHPPLPSGSTCSTTEEKESSVYSTSIVSSSSGVICKVETVAKAETPAPVTLPSPAHSAIVVEETAKVVPSAVNTEAAKEDKSKEKEDDVTSDDEIVEVFPVTLEWDDPPSKHDKEFWSSLYPPRFCPRGCGPVEGKTERYNHYKKFHYPVFYELENSEMTKMEKWFNIKLGCKNTGSRVCTICPSSIPFNFSNRYRLMQHIREVHRELIPEMAEEYKAIRKRELCLYRSLEDLLLTPLPS